MEEFGYQVLDFLWEYPIALIVVGVGVFFGLRRLMRPRFPVVFRGKVVWVCDGDTIWVRTAWGFKRKIRLRGMDAPESEQKWGDESQQLLNDLVGGRRVVLTATDRDMYGRWVCKVECGGTDASLAMIEAGLAWPYYYYLKQFPAEERWRYLEAGRRAKQNRRGMWSDPKLEAPWDWRRRHRSIWKRLWAWIKRMLAKVFGF